ncbi:ATP-dependent RNA helicase DbpA [Wohlfahrtiimonas chitiniclastica]|uniref:ATP-dependent RNA helicase DbpA n=1 Tax=Wohlfahrtiimonas chitiniclastica TaxID=400946 RepID=UPI000B982DCC|nr:ATP-dependent RNA helicase DbpA [Wohlfahrtiimonas chitiniclastica]OYQ71252.1 ATP-dependent RNA helicase DbpA [Wohlfahrtiimonas chitiniclastica]OYQ82898.1 ATP-dependent RNA helicase DbpA [Wohlfahrtiimonas chitiniclastica]OYQ85069.1 ATP-dependent RNA helicase DbpA [Wohlfahrtiimonas chitiniclastica]OYQ86697.1 ATP-dependent RNA helicase DbpA [Wohlfahrtiimonas chitiniclastica]
MQFSELPLPAAQLKNLQDLGYQSTTPIQAAALPAILKGKDLLGQAKTGSGKTAAFGIGVLESIDVTRFATQALVICPTRELADQVSKELRRLARYIPNLKISSICGGTPIARQIHAMSQHPPHIAVGTPGRLLDHLKRNTLSLKSLKVLVLDEADRMLDMGFADEMDAIIEHAPRQRQTLLFSATFPENIESISARIQHNPVRVTVEETPEDKPNIDQSVVIVDNQGAKAATTAALLYHYAPESTVIFCNTIAACQELEDYLFEQDIDVVSLHGDLEQRERDQVLLRFSNSSTRVLVATDVAARGLDIADLSMVINYDLPFDPEVYVHRIGRTGRAGKTGIAVSLVVMDKLHRLQEIEKYQDQAIAQYPAEHFKDVKPISLIAKMSTIEISEGKKSKISAGDILGTLTAKGEIAGKDVGKITLLPMQAYVAISRAHAKQAVDQIWKNPIKNIRCRARIIGD